MLDHDIALPTDTRPVSRGQAIPATYFGSVIMVDIKPNTTELTEPLYCSLVWGVADIAVRFAIGLDPVPEFGMMVPANTMICRAIIPGHRIGFYNQSGSGKGYLELAMTTEQRQQATAEAEAFMAKQAERG